MVSESITVTGVGLGGDLDDLDDQLLGMIAEVGGGRCLRVPDANNQPRVFTTETAMIVGQGITAPSWPPAPEARSLRVRADRATVRTPTLPLRWKRGRAHAWRERRREAPGWEAGPDPRGEKVTYTRSCGPASCGRRLPCLSSTFCCAAYDF